MIPLKHPTVVVPLDYASPGVMWGTVSDESREKAIRENLGKVLAKIGAQGVQVAVPIGDPGLKITDYAKDVNADLIIVPSHGFHGVKRFLLGSTAERIIRHAHCSVLVLRRRDAE